MPPGAIAEYSLMVDAAMGLDKDSPESLQHADANLSPEVAEMSNYLASRCVAGLSDPGPLPNGLGGGDIGPLGPPHPSFPPSLPHPVHRPLPKLSEPDLCRAPALSSEGERRREEEEEVAQEVDMSMDVDVSQDSTSHHRQRLLGRRVVGKEEEGEEESRGEREMDFRKEMEAKSPVENGDVFPTVNGSRAFSPPMRSSQPLFA